MFLAVMMFYVSYFFVLLSIKRRTGAKDVINLFFLEFFSVSGRVQIFIHFFFV